MKILQKLFATST